MTRAEIIDYALLGFDIQLQRIGQGIDAVQRVLARRTAKPRRKRSLSPEGRAAIVAAAKRRWAKIRRAQPRAA